MTDMEKLLAYQQYSDMFVTARHILLFTIDTYTGYALPAETVEANRAKAYEALDRIRAGESFESIQAEYSEDPTTGGMTFSTGEFVEEFETAAWALNVGEVSGVVETEYGFHIIQRVDLQGDRWDDFYEYCVQEKYYSFMSPKIEEAKIAEKKAYKNLVIQ